MGKRKNQPLIDGDSSNDFTSDLNSEFLNLAKNKNRGARSDSDSDSESNNDNKNNKKQKRESSDSEPENKGDAKNSEPEKGEVSDSSISDKEYNDGYDDQLMGDEEDRARLASLIEKERETEIFKRSEQRQLMKRRFEIEKKLRQARKAERAREKSHKNKDRNYSKLQTDFISIDDKERSKEKKKNIEENSGGVDKKVNAMVELKARREDRQKREEAGETRKEEQRKKKVEDAVHSTNKNALKLKASDISSDNSENEAGKSLPEPIRQSVGSVISRSKSSSSSSINEQEEVEKPVYVPTRVDMNNIRLSRHLLEQFIHLPFFDRVVKGCYVKIGFGQHNNLLVYRVVEIINVFETAKIYNLGNARTNKSLRVRHGTQECVFRLEFVSNQEFTDIEFVKWIEANTVASNPLPSKEHIEQKQADINEAINYEFNEQDVERIIREKGRFKRNPHNYAMRKTQLMNERDSAMARGDKEIARKLTQNLSDLEERASELDKKRTSTISSISCINYRNRKRNVEEAEKAIMAEVKANKGKKIDDPFTRRSTRPRMNFKTELGKKLEPITERKPEKQPVPAQPAQVIKDDLFSAHDFDIEIDLDVPSPRQIIVYHNRASTNLTPRTATKDLAPRRIVNLQDYKKKRGLI